MEIYCQEQLCFSLKVLTSLISELKYRRRISYVPMTRITRRIHKQTSVGRKNTPCIGRKMYLVEMSLNIISRDSRRFQ